MILAADNSIGRFIAWLFARSRPEGGEGLESTLRHTWPMPPWVTLLLLLAAGVFVVAVYLRESGGVSRRVRVGLALIRLTLVGLILFMMHEFFLQPYRTDLPDLIVVVDDSASMALTDLYDDKKLAAAIDKRLDKAGFADTTRLSQAKAILLGDDASLATSLDRKYNVKYFLLGSTPRPVAGSPEEIRRQLRSLSANQPVSRLGGGLRQMLQGQRGRPTAAAVLLTDGITTEGRTISEVADYARRKAVPLYLVGLGSRQPMRDLALGDLLVDDVVFVNDVVNFDLTLTATGFEGRKVEVRLHREGETAPLGSRELTVGPDGTTQRIRLPYRPTEKGDFRFAVAVEPLPGETQLQNNRRTATLSVLDEKIRVLLLQEYPNYEFRYLKSLLGRETKDAQGRTENPVQLHTVLQEADPEYADTDRTALRVFPVRRDQLLDNYDVIIFGDANPALLGTTAMQHVDQFVRQRGGGVVFIAGERFMPAAYRDSPLAGLMPVDPATATTPERGVWIRDPFQLRLTPLGMVSPQMQLLDEPAENIALWQNLPGMYWLLRAETLKSGTRVLAEHPTLVGADGRNLPVVCMQYVGAGKVVFHGAHESWRWRRRPDGDAFARYWMQTIRYLSRTNLMDEDRLATLSTDRKKYRLGDPVRLWVRFLDERRAPAEDDGVEVVLQRLGHKTQRVKLQRSSERRGVFEAAVENLPTGQYHGSVAVPAFEGAAPSCNFPIEAPLGEDARTAMDADDLRRAVELSKGRFFTFATADKLAGQLPRGRPVRIDTLPPEPIWNSWKVALAFVILLTAEWLLRKRAGLL